MEKQTKKQLFWEIFRFLLVGGGATLVDYFVFWLFDGVLFPLIFADARGATLSLIVSTALGFCAGLVVNWLLSITFVFRQVRDEAQAKSKKAFVIFTVVGVIGLLLTEIGVVGLTAIFPEIALFGSASLFGTEWKKWLAKAIMTCIVLAWNYVGRKILVFKS